MYYKTNMFPSVYMFVCVLQVCCAGQVLAVFLRLCLSCSFEIMSTHYIDLTESKSHLSYHPSADTISADHHTWLCDVGFEDLTLVLFVWQALCGASQFDIFFYYK